MTLPRVTPTVLAEAVDALPARLRKKVDDAVTRYAALPVTEAAGRYTVVVDEATTVTLSPVDGVLRTADAVSCTCLLSPNCLHRAAILGRCPADDGPDPADDGPDPGDPGPDSGDHGAYAHDAATDPRDASTDPGNHGSDPRDASTDPGNHGSDPGGRGSDSHDGGTSLGLGGARPDDARASVGGARPGKTAQPGGSAEPSVMEGTTLTPAQTAAVENLWAAATTVLTAGVTGAGVVVRTALLRAAHDAQATRVYRPATAARAVASLLQAARAREPQYRLGDLTDALRDLLSVLHQLRRAPDGALLGAGRRPYDVQGSLRLYGLCTTAVLTDSGYAGVLTYVGDRDGRLWTIADLLPGDARRAAAAGNATVALGETALSHRALTRGGLVVTGATASASRQLGAGKSVRAVTAAGAGWLDEPFAPLWTRPLDEQVHRAFAASVLPVTERPAGDDLLFLRVRLTGGGEAVTADGTRLSFGVVSDHPALAYRDNLRLLAGQRDLEVLVVGRPDPGRRGTVLPLAVAPGAGWTMERGHADLAFDRLHSSDLPAVDERPQPVTDSERTTADPALQLLRAQVDRTVAGGRTILALGGRYPSDAGALRRARLDTGAALLDGLTLAASTRPRDPFGRLTGDDGTAFAQAWLATAAYTDAASRAFAEASWLGTAPAVAAMG